MPRDVTHIILADEAAEIINDKDIRDNPEAFHMGCIADDSFLYTMSPKLSSRLHGMFRDDTRAIVLEMADELKKENEPHKRAEKKAFIAGYVCHMAADCTFHPLIYSISGSHFNASSKREAEISKACHRCAETWLDMYFMRAEKMSFKNFRPFRKIIKRVAMRVRIDDFFTDCVQRVLKAKKYTWGDNFDLQSQFHNGMTRQLFVDKVTQSQTIGKMLRKLDTLFNGKLKLYTSGFYNVNGEVPQLLTKGSFIHPVTGEKIDKSLGDLRHDAVQTSVKFIKAVDEYIKSGDKEVFLQSVPNINLDTGIENTGREALKNKMAPGVFAMMTGERKKAKKAMKEDSTVTQKVIKKERKQAIKRAKGEAVFFNNPINTDNDFPKNTMMREDEAEEKQTTSGNNQPEKQKKISFNERI